MPFRFQRLTTLYPAFQRQFLAANPDWRSWSHDALLEQLLAARFAESDYHARHLRSLGHVAETRFLSCEPLQKKWAVEEGVPFRPEHALFDIAMAQVRAFQPDVVWLDDLYFMDRAFRDQIRQLCGTGTLLVGWRAAPTDDYAQFRDLDLVLTSIRGLADKFRGAGVPVELVHHGFEASLLHDLPPARARDIPFSFAGGVGSLHPQRADLVTGLLARTNLCVWGAEPPRRRRDHIALALARLGIPCGRKSRQWRIAARYPDRLHAPVFGRDYYAVLGRSQLVLNAHISCSSSDASNMRLYEGTGMGACLLTDWKPNLAELFEPDVEVATYRSLDECVEKARYLLDHETERTAIAAAGQRRTLTEHTIANRVRTMESILLRRLHETCRRRAA